MIKIAHEAPSDIFEDVQSLTDYDYALVHLLVENSRYANKFLQASQRGREIILDNSIFELGEAFDSEKYFEWIQRLQPTWYIIPDVLEDSIGTVRKANNFLEQYREQISCKSIAVVQGKNYQELINCYRSLVELEVDMIAVSFDYSYYESLYPQSPQLEAWSKGRTHFLQQLSRESCFRRDIPLHLLGCSVLQEFSNYNSKFMKLHGIKIYSLDTSNPVVCGIQGIQYPEDNKGMSTKPSMKLFKLIDYSLNWRERLRVHYNILRFREIVNGKLH
jgi:hypothetical protein